MRKPKHTALPSILWKLGVSLTLLVGLLASTAAVVNAQTPVCANTTTANVVAFDQIFFYNRLGSFDPGGMIFALMRDVIAIDATKPLGPGNAQLRADKRARPIVLRVHEGDCLQVTFTNWLDPNRADVANLKFVNLPANQPFFGPPVTLPDGTVHTAQVALSPNDTPATRNASMHVNGLDLVNGIGSDGSFVGNNASSLAAPGQTIVYTWYGAKQGQYLLFSTAATSGGEGDGGQIVHGLFGSVNVEPKGSLWYRSQVTGAQLAAASTGTTPMGQPIINYNAVDANGDPILNILKGNEIIRTDLNAVITDASGLLQEDCTTAPPSGTCGQPYREFTIIFHDELETGKPAFPEMLTDNSVFHSVRDGFGVNYGSASVGSEVLANRKKVGPQANCVECEYEEFFLESWSNSDPATLVAYGPPDPTTGIAKAVAGLFQDDPANVHHSYIGDPVRMRNLHAGPKETHVFHLHQHQWLQSPRDPNSTYLDSQTISPGASFMYEIQYGGGGNRNLGSPGDSIFHCHLYPHFAQGMWELWRNHDVFEVGTADRNLPDGEIAAGIPQPALVPIPFLFQRDKNGVVISAQGMAPMPTAARPGYPFFMAGMAGHRPSQPPFGLENDGGLPRHEILSGQSVDGLTAIPAARQNDPIFQRVHSRNVDPFLVGFARKLASANIQLLPANGTALEQTSMQYHQGILPPAGSTAQSLTTQHGWPAIGYTTFTPFGTVAPNVPTLFLINGLPPAPGAPYSDPCPPTFVDGNGTTRQTPLRKYRTAWIQFDNAINTAGWHDRQQRIAVLEQDVTATLNGTRPAEPLFFRANSGDCIDYRVTNLIPADLNLDDFQVYQGTDIIGQHIHLVKFDVTSSDGAGNGWNYESGALSPEAVQDLIAANNAFQQSIGGTQILTAKTNPTFGAGPNNAYMGAQTLIERWWADPLVNNNGKDRTLRTVFTHDHFSPSGHQHHGLYAGLVIEPTDSTWTSLDGNTTFGTRADGGPTSFAANIIAGPSGANSYREFMMEIGDFAIVYTPAPALQPVNPPNRVEHALPIVAGSPVVNDPSQNPLPEAISAADPGTQVMNYRNEPLPLRIGSANAQGQFVQNVGQAGDLAYAFSSNVHSDPFTPLFRAYTGDRLQIRLLQGAQEEQHVINVHGHKWLFEPGTPTDSASVNNSGYTNSQAIGISEHFEFVMGDGELPVFNPKGTADFLYQSSATDNLWDGMWGILRTYAKTQKDLALLPNNTNPTGKLPQNVFTNGLCPVVPGVPIRTYTVDAYLAKDLVGANGIVYNKRFGFHDSAGIVYINDGDLNAILAGTKPLEPLVLRANAGDCIQITLQNNLTSVLPEYDSWNFLPPIVPAFNFNQIQASRRVSLHPQLLLYSVSSSDGSAVGFNADSTVGPGGTINYAMYAGNVSVNASGQVQLTPIEFGVTHLRDFADVIKHSSHGGIGALIIEPQGSSWTTVGNSSLMADVTNSSGTVLFREFVTMYQDDLTMQNSSGAAMMNIRGTDDSEDSGMKGFNYKTEPLWARLGFPPETDLRTLNNQDFTNTLSSTASNPGCGGACGDPATSVFTAKAGTPVRFRVIDVAGHPRMHGFTLFGHHWNFEPWTQNSTVQGNNPMTFEIGSYSGIGPTRHLNILTPAGGLFHIPGDYLYRTQESFQFSGGLWGILRVTP